MLFASGFVSPTAANGGGGSPALQGSDKYLLVCTELNPALGNCPLRGAGVTPQAGPNRKGGGELISRFVGFKGTLGLQD